MSNDQRKTSGNAGDQPILLGAPNDPKLIGKVDLFTGAGLDTAIAKLDAFAGGAFAEGSDEDPFPFGIEAPEETSPHAPETVRIPQGVEATGDPEPGSVEPDPEDVDAADGLDRILDTLAAEEVTDDLEPHASPVTLADLERRLDQGQEVPAAPVSPIADILARTGEIEADLDEGFYDDPGVPADLYGDEIEVRDLASEDMEINEVEGDTDTAPYDPLSDIDAFDNHEDDQVQESETLDLDPDLDKVAPEDDIFGEMDATSEDASSDSTEAGFSYALPEPSPMGDPTGMGGLFAYDDPVQGVVATDEASDIDTEDDLFLRNFDENDAEDDKGQDRVTDEDWGPIPAPIKRTPPATDGSVLDALMADLNKGATIAVAPEEAPDTPDAPGLESKGQGASALPGFLRPGAVSGLGRLSDERPPVLDVPQTEITDTRVWGRDPSPDAPTPPESQEREDDMPVEDAVDTGEEVQVEGTSEPVTPRSGRRRLLAGVAAVALVAAGFGAFVLMSELVPSGPVQIAQAPADQLPTPPITSTFDGLADTQQDPVVTLETGLVTLSSPETSVEEVSDPSLVTTTADVTTVQNEDPEADAPEETSPAAIAVPNWPVTSIPDLMGPGADPSITTPMVVAEPEVEPEVGTATPDSSGVPSEVADLMREIERADTPAPDTSSVLISEMQAQMAELEARLLVSQERSDAASSEMTGLTDQITGVLQRNSEQAERIDRMERLIRGQSAILAQVGQMEESLEQTQIVLLDVSSRIGKVEGQNPADRDAVNRALADVESRLQALTANMSILARMSIEGVDVLRATGASSGTVGVQTAPGGGDGTGGTNTVFQTQTGGFRISSDAAGRIPATVKKDDFIEGYGYVMDVLPASDGQRLVVMENGSVLIPGAD